MAEARDRESEDQREHLLRMLSAATFLIFFQAYMVAPLIPRLSTVFGVASQTIGFIVPAYMIPYGVSTLFYGLLSDRLRRPHRSHGHSAVRLAADLVAPLDRARC